MTAVVVIAFLVFMMIGVPIAFAFGLAAFAGLGVSGLPLNMVAQKMLHSVDSFPFMAIPFFMLAGEFLVAGGLMEKMIQFANAVVGRVRGGLGHVTVVSGVGLATVSGTATADSMALSSVLLRPMARVYGVPFSAAIIAASANLGPIIPPSTAMIIYATIAGGSISIAGLFASGIVPGLLIAVFMMLAIEVIARRRRYPISGEPFRLGFALRKAREAILILLMPVIVLGGILSGAFTATESAAIAVVYAFLAGMFVTRKLKWSDIPNAMLNAVITTSVVSTLIAFSATVTFLFTVDLVPQRLSETIMQVASSPLAFLVIVMLFLILVGTVIEPVPAYIMLVPILAPIATGFGIDPLHFALVFVINIAIGVLTPPVGSVLFLMCSAARLSIWELFREIWPFVAIQYLVMFICVFAPGLVLWLPRTLGY